VLTAATAQRSQEIDCVAYSVRIKIKRLAETPQAFFNFVIQ